MVSREEIPTGVLEGLHLWRGGEIMGMGVHGDLVRKRAAPDDSVSAGLAAESRVRQQLAALLR